MAHFKRKRSRALHSGSYSSNALERRLGSRYHQRAWLESYPRSWDKICHTRPGRAKARLAERDILRGADPDEVLWPLGKKPHIYYW